MSKFILGSGVVGLLAKMILGNDWEIIPFKRSRFFSFNPSLCDNFIIRDDSIDHFITTELKGNLAGIYNCAYSIHGNLVRQHDKLLSSAWVGKVTQDPPQHTQYILKDRLSFGIYDIKVNSLYASLLSRFTPSTKEITGISDTEIKFSDGSSSAYDKIVSTVPLNILYKLMGKQPTLTYGNSYYYHVQTKDLNFEGANQVWVVDSDILFYKVSMISENHFMFYFNDMLKPHEHIGQYLMKFMPRFDIIDGTAMNDSIPTGLKPDLTIVERKNIIPVGMLAEHDLSADIGSNIKKLIRLSKGI